MKEKIKLVQNLDNPSIYVVPKEYEREGISIDQVFLDGVFVDKRSFERIGPRKISFGIKVGTGITVEATLNGE